MRWNYKLSSHFKYNACLFSNPLPISGGGFFLR